MSATDCCAECETQGCVSGATALAAAAHRATLAAHRAPCHWTLPVHRAPCHWPHSWLTGRRVTGHLRLTGRRVTSLTRCSQGAVSLASLAAHRAPCHWTLAALAGRCRTTWLPGNQGSPQPPALRTDPTAHPHSRKEQTSKCALYQMWVTFAPP